MKNASMLEVLAWMVISERWSQLRELLQALPTDGWESNLELIVLHYGYTASAIGGPVDIEAADRLRRANEEQLRTGANVIARAPDRQRAPDMGSFIHAFILGTGDVAGRIRNLQHCDEVCRRYGL
jgi:hypothetical protein